MAKTFLAVAVVIVFAAGCQQQTATIDPLPKPSFDAPVVLAATPPVVRQTAPIPQVQPKPAQPPVMGVPREWLPLAKARPWQWIVIHHSATPTGGAVAFDRMHKEKGWDGLGYHFVIGNGSDTPDGMIEVGPRWPIQKWGAHTKTPGNEYNDFGIGICLVGNFDNGRPTAAQMKSLAKLTAYMMQTYHIPAANVKGHRDCKSTDCPGRNVNIAEIRQLASQLLAQGGVSSGMEGVRTANAAILPGR